MEVREGSAQGKAKSLYAAMASERQEYLRRAYECAKLTIPSLIPTETDQSRKNQDITISQPWQSVGAMGVNALAAKLVQTILPTNTPFFRLNMGRKAREELLQLEGEDAAQFAAEIEAGLQNIEQEVTGSFEREGLRTNLFNLVKHALVAGNYLLYTGDKPKGFPMYKYVVSRDSSGNLMKIIVREIVDKKTLPENIRAALKNDAERYSKDKETGENDECELYTVVERLNSTTWKSWQEIEGMMVPGSMGRYNDETLPWIAVRMIPIDGEDYGRSYVEEHFGDLRSAEDLARALVEGGVLSAKLLWMVNPSGLTDADDIIEAENGDVVEGRPDDVQALRAEKLADFTVAERALISIVQRLERAFLMVQGVQRQAERVTAYEISLLAQELEDTLGGYYSLFAMELQLPLVRRKMHTMAKAGELPGLPQGAVEPVIITGVAALGRGQDLTKLRGLAQDLLALGPILPTMARRIDEGELMQRFANGHGVDVAGLFKSDEQVQQEIQAEQQAAAQQELISKGTGPAINAIANQAQQQGTQ